MPRASLHALAAVRLPTGAGFDVLLLLHVACALAGVATVVVSAAQAVRLRSVPLGSDPPANLRRYYAPGVNWAGRLLYGVPVFGFGLLAASGGAFGLGDAWVMAGLAIWVVATLAGEGALWPAERRLQQLVSAGSSETLATECRTVLLAATGMLVLLIVAFVLMVGRP